MNLEGHVAVVTGASRGVGRAIAEALEARGLAVATVARRSAQFTADVSNPADVDRLKTAVEAELGRPTVLVNAAGIFGPIALVQDGDPEEWVETLMINAVGPYLVSRAFLDGMLDAGWGRIVNLSSAASLHTPGRLNSAYGTAKVALNQFTRHLAAEIEGTGVTANVIHPGDVKTAMWADIRDKMDTVSERGYHDWVAWVEQTGGDPPRKGGQARDRHHRERRQRALSLDRRSASDPDSELGLGCGVGGVSPTQQAMPKVINPLGYRYSSSPRYPKQPSAHPGPPPAVPRRRCPGGQDTPGQRGIACR